MKLLIFLMCLTAYVFSPIQGLAQEVYADTIRTVDGRDSIYIQAAQIKIIRDTVWIQPESEKPPTDIIKTKAIGRYDRGILNYRFIPKGNWIGGVTFSYLNFESDDSRLLFSLLDGFDFHGRTLSVKPFVGFAIKDNVVIGFKFGYNHTLGQLDNLALNMDDLDFSLHDIRYVEDMYTYALFHRSFVGLDSDRRFGLFNEISLGYNTGSSRFSRDKDESLKVTETKVHELHLGVNPGICVFIMDNVSAEVSFGVVGFKYRYEKQKNNLGEVGHSRNSGANFKINILNINIGITACF